MGGSKSKPEPEIVYKYIEKPREPSPPRPPPKIVYIDRPTTPPSPKIVYIERPRTPPIDILYQPPVIIRKLTDTPWRKPSDWNKELEEELLSDIKKLNPKEKPSLLLLGPVGAGKSSFINAILTIGKGRKVDRAFTGGGEKSYTTSYDKYTEKTLLQKFRLRDCMGIEQSENEGFHVKDLVALLKGHVKNKYEFNPRSPISEESKEYRKEPKFEHQTHCVVFVVDSGTVNAGIPPNYVKKIKALQDEVKKLRIPRVLILTKTDKLCPEVEKDVTKMFRSILVRDAVRVASEVFNIPQASIHPVKNYEESIDIDWETNIPLLLALRQIMQYADDRVETVLDASDSDSDSDSD